MDNELETAEADFEQPRTIPQMAEQWRQVKAIMNEPGKPSSEPAQATHKRLTGEEREGIRDRLVQRQERAKLPAVGGLPITHRVVQKIDIGVDEDMGRLLADLEAADRETQRLKGLWATSDHEIEQILGKALGYPWFKDDQQNFPGAGEAEGVCVGEHVPASIAMEAAGEIERLKAQLAECTARFERVLIASPDALRNTVAEVEGYHEQVYGEWMQASPPDIKAQHLGTDAGLTRKAFEARDRMAAQLAETKGDLENAEAMFADMSNARREEKETADDMQSHATRLMVYLMLLCSASEGLVRLFPKTPEQMAKLPLSAQYHIPRAERRLRRVWKDSDAAIKAYLYRDERRKAAQDS